METREITALRSRFIRVTMLSVLLVMVGIGSLLNIAQTISARYQIRHTLSAIIDDRGRLKSADAKESTNGETAISPFDGFNFFDIEYLSGISYFTVILNKKRAADVLLVRTDNLQKADVLILAKKMLARKKPFGQYGTYFYQYQKRPDGSIVIAALDYQNGIYAAYRLAAITVVICLTGMFIIYWLVRSFSRLAIRPMIQNAERQKQFITNASHELKTPLAVIRSNTEFSEMLGGENEWTRSTLKQVARMDELVKELVLITRSDEKQNAQGIVPVDLSAVTRETAEALSGLARQSGKHLETDIQSDITLTGGEGDMHKLVSVLLDNAVKYCDDGGTIRLRLKCYQSRLRRETVLLSVANDYADGAGVDYQRFFDRFYRGDATHHVDGPEQAGYGIGLSLAESLCRKYHGRITARWKDGVITFTCLLRSIRS
ncbi:HAMP domain-containing sensor histidine kinase [Pseudoramibacter faecis]|uniref:sensor histidine kinase n=1 Tax=Pseudoramibacter faecis TaxID=3108534 RepID=UPI002E75F258|nr:HAMP domain-containing sensor histidine kinase [Pseudoramibacter sp. HA2172]